MPDYFSTSLLGSVRVPKRNAEITPKSGLEKFAELHSKYVTGKAWLTAREARGLDVKKDTEDFFANVQDPFDALYNSMTPDEKVEADTIMGLCKKFKAKRVKFTPEVKKRC